MNQSLLIFLIIALIFILFFLVFYWWKNRIGVIEPPVPRAYIETSSEMELKNTYIDKIRVSSYNLLADNVSFRILNHCPYEFLHFNYRSVRIVQEIDSSHPDIFCLQEVDHYRRFYKKEFEKIGYFTILNKRRRCCRHGVVIGFLTAKYQLLEVSNVDFNEVDPNDNYYRTNSAAVIALLKNTKTQTLLIVSSVHTWFISKVVIYAQIAFLLYRIEQFIKKNKNLYPELSMEETPLIIGGDFNSGPSSNTIRYMQNLPPLVNDINPEEKRRILHIWEQFKHCFRLKSAYENYKLHKEKGEENEMIVMGEDLHPDYTLVKMFCSKRFKACLDYLWYNKGTMDVIKLLEIPDEMTIAQKGLPGLPNSLFSSDHLRIEAEFGIKNKILSI